MKNKETAVCVVANFKYIYKNIDRFINQLRQSGNYSGDILIITNIFSPTFLIKSVRSDSKVKVFRFKRIKFNKETHSTLKNLIPKPSRHVTKNFQWHKLYLFHRKLRKWKYIFYLDINMNIHHDINPVLDVTPEKEIFARADGFPTYTWKLSSQFDNSHKLFKKLREEYDLDSINYFQTGVLYFDTDIIENETMSNILNLINKYPISITNEQGILNIYFMYIKKQYSHLIEDVDKKLSYFYWKLPNKEVIITKSTVEQYK